MNVFQKLALATAHAYLFGVHNRADRDRVKRLYDEANAVAFPPPDPGSEIEADSQAEASSKPARKRARRPVSKRR